MKLPSLEDMKLALTRYFNSDLELTQKDYDTVYDVFAGDLQKKTLALPHESYAYTEANPWSIKLKEVMYDAALKQYTVYLDHVASRTTGRISQTDVITLKERKPEELYIESIAYTYPDARWVEITGEHALLKAEDFGAELEPYSQPASLYGMDIGGKLLIRGQRFTDNGVSTGTTFSIYDPDTGSVGGTFTVPAEEGNSFYDVRVLDDRIVFKMRRSYFCTDLNLKRIPGSERQLPLVVQKPGGTDWDFFGYDISRDLKSIVFTADTGLYAYQVDTGKKTLLSGHVEVKSDLYDTAYIYNPRYLAEDKSVLARLSGYEGDYGILLVGFDAAGRSMAPVVYQDNLFPAEINWTNSEYPTPVMAPVKAGDNRTSFQLALNDFTSFSAGGKVKAMNYAIHFEDEANQQPIMSLDRFAVYNGQYMAYVASEGNITDDRDENNRYQVVVVDLKTMEARTTARVKAGIPYVLAVTSDGHVLFSYHFEREAGLVITDKE